MYLGVVPLGVLAVLWLLERNLVFRPLTPAQSWDQPADPATEDLTLESRDGTRIHAWWLPPRDPAAGAFLVAHGNGGNLSHRGELAAGLRKTTDAGVLLFDYPGYGKSEGKPTEAGCYAAGEAAFQWLTETAGIPEYRIVLMGESLGGGTAVELATRHDHKALVLIFTFTSLPEVAKTHFRLLPTHSLMRTRFDNISKIGRCHRPVFIAHGTADGIVPFPHGEALFAAANSPKEFLRMEGVGHDLALGSRLYTPLARFLREADRGSLIAAAR
jgi:fermentation-respiration switch protein FrsA (DUF1100 family)